MRYSSAQTAVVSYRALWTTTNMPPHINGEGVFREMKLRGHYEEPSTWERRREKREKAAQRRVEHVAAIAGVPEDKKA
jgi:hypothetical protein